MINHLISVIKIENKKNAWQKEILDNEYLWSKINNGYLDSLFLLWCNKKYLVAFILWIQKTHTSCEQTCLGHISSLKFLKEEFR